MGRVRIRMAPGKIGARRRIPQRAAPKVGSGSSGLQVLQHLVQTAFTSQTRLGTFLSSMCSFSKHQIQPPQQDTTITADAEPQRSDGPLPCPPPPFRDPRESMQVSSPRGRRRVQERQVAAQLVALQIGSLSFQALGRPDTAPAQARVGASATPQQKRLAKRLSQKVHRLVRAISTVRLDAGVGRKADTVLDFLKELGEKELAKEYGSCRDAVSGNGKEEGEGSRRRRKAPRQVDVDRLDLPPPGVAGSFDLSSYLREDVRAAFLEPDVLIEPADPSAVQPPTVQPEMQPAARPEANRPYSPPHPPNRRRRARHYVRERDNVAFLGALDEAGMLDFGLESEVGEDEAGMFPFAKSAERDRLITNRRPRNARERKIGASADLFPHGCMLVDFLLSRRGRLRGSGDDLPDFYHTIEVSSARARSNVFGPPLRFSDIAHLAAGRRLVERLRQEGRSLPEACFYVRALQKTLPMGDRNATCFAELGHLGVLDAAGALDRDALVSYHSPPPRDDLWQFVMIDDHILIQATDTASRHSGRDTELRDDIILQRSEEAYAAAGLAPKPSKRFRKEPVFNAVGARVDGRQGWVSAKVELILVALALSTQLAAAGAWNASVLATTNACWVQILLYRRAGFCLLERSYQAVAEVGPTDQVWRRLHPAVIDELLLVCLNVASCAHRSATRCSARTRPAGAGPALAASRLSYQTRSCGSYGVIELVAAVTYGRRQQRKLLLAGSPSTEMRMTSLITTSQPVAMCAGLVESATRWGGHPFFPTHPLRLTLTFRNSKACARSCGVLRNRRPGLVDS